MAADPLPVSQYLNIPAELRALPNWCVWQYQITPYGKTKIPRNPVSSDGRADSTDPNTWVSFDVACANVGRFEGIGFFFSQSAGYVGIDLDHTDDAGLADKHNLIKTFSKSYAEYSPSGKGVHIICKGSIPRGVKSSSKKIEMYSNSRFFTMTGNVFRDAVPTEEQAMLDFLFSEIGKLKDVEGLEAADKPETEDDQTIYNRAAHAVNGTKFALLWQGDWRQAYNSQSEADQALINILGFYSSNFAQIARMFRFSQLGKRDKAKREDYVRTMIRKAMDNKPPTVEALMTMSRDFSALLEAQKIAAGSQQENEPASQPAAELTVAQGEDAPQEAYSLPKSAGKGPAFTMPPIGREWALNPPPGLVRDVAGFIYEQARLPVHEIALAGSLAFLAGICGRAFNVSGTGLNLYLTLLAESGRGKEAMAGGIDKLIASMMMSNPLCDKVVGPSVISSGQALMPYIKNQSNSFVCILTEFNNMLSQMTSRTPNVAQAQLNANLLSFYSKSGNGSVVRPAIYADAKKNVESVLSPAVTLLGESTITHMRHTVSPDIVTSGLLPRFVNIVYDGDRVPDNETPKRAPEMALVGKLVSLFGASMQLNSMNRVFDIGFEDDAQEYIKSANEFLRQRMNDKNNTQYNELWNRCLLNIMKISALCAIELVGDQPNWHAKIKLEHVQWAAAIVFNSVQWWLKSFDSHEIGEQNNDIAQARDLRRKLKGFFDLPTEKQVAYRASAEMVRDWIVPYRYLVACTAGLSSFKNLERQGGQIGALKRVLSMLVDAGEIEEASKAQNYHQLYGNRALAYRIVAMAKPE